MSSRSQPKYYSVMIASIRFEHEHEHEHEHGARRTENEEIRCEARTRFSSDAFEAVPLNHLRITNQSIYWIDLLDRCGSALHGF
jgi:hypothetical protein